MDLKQIEEGIRLILKGIGENPEREGIKKTPERVARMYQEIFAGLKVDASSIITTTFAEKHDEMILVKDIPLYSLCEHHLMPFLGKAHVAYVPNKDGRVVGISKLARVVDILAKRPQVQERLTTEIADALEKALQPRGVLVVVEAEHLCMSMRGVNKPGALTITSAVRGIFRANPATRAEALSLIKP